MPIRRGKVTRSTNGDGDTLVIDTIGFNDRGWMDIYPRTEKLHIVERYKRVDFGHLQLDATIEDPGVFAKPWQMHMSWDLAPQEELHEYVCENNKAQNMVGTNKTLRKTS